MYDDFHMGRKMSHVVRVRGQDEIQGRNSIAFSEHNPMMPRALSPGYERKERTDPKRNENNGEAVSPENARDRTDPRRYEYHHDDQIVTLGDDRKVSARFMAPGRHDLMSKHSHESIEEEEVPNEESDLQMPH